MICYRLKHIPSGLYYRPSSEIQIKVGGKSCYVKSNLSKKGKIYPTKPSLSWIDHGFYNHVQLTNDKMIDFLADGKVSLDRDRTCAFKVYPYVESDWVIEEC